MVLCITVQAFSIQNMERRQHNLSAEKLWSRLTLSQQFSVSSLNQYGYELAFIRQHESGDSLAVLFSGDNAATINNYGEINTSPDITFR